MIVEEEQEGKARAEYGKGLLRELSTYLNSRVGKGFSVATLRNARQFYRTYSSTIQQTLFSELKTGSDAPKGQMLFAQYYPFTLSWSHYLILMRIQNEQERRFYEIEATRQQWTFR